MNPSAARAVRGLLADGCGHSRLTKQWPVTPTQVRAPEHQHLPDSAQAGEQGLQGAQPLLAYASGATVVLVHSPPTTAPCDHEGHDDNDDARAPTHLNPAPASLPPAPALLRGLLPLSTLLQRGGASDGEAAGAQPEQQHQTDVSTLAWGAYPQLLAVGAGHTVAVIHLPLVSTTTDATDSCQQQADASPTAGELRWRAPGDPGPAWSARGCFRVDATVTGTQHG
jgi:hypothetical protein